MLSDLIKICRKYSTIYIQTHDFPDPDALSSAYGLQEILRHYNIQSTIIYSGLHQRKNIKELIEKYSIDHIIADDYKFKKNAASVIVDTKPNFTNISFMHYNVIAVIDHHLGRLTKKHTYVDVRSKVGATSSIIAEYFFENNIPVSKRAATTLCLGIYTDTMHLLRDVSTLDMDMFHSLYGIADKNYFQHLAGNNYEISDMPLFKQALSTIMLYKKKYLFSFIGDKVSSNEIAMISDFLLQMKEVSFTCVGGISQNNILISLRSESNSVNTREIINAVMGKHGRGGGHSHMAAAVIPGTGRNRLNAVNNLFTSIQKELRKRI
ncbi:bifunctional oligoribonuclease/PAP phosphatase NrnA [Spirochaetota bacterium]